MYAALSVFDGHIMLSDEFPEYGPGVLSPLTVGGASITVTISLEDPAQVDAVMQKAVAEGARITMPASDMFWGARYGRLVDPFGHYWAFSGPETVINQENADHG